MTDMKIGDELTVDVIDTVYAQDWPVVDPLRVSGRVAARLDVELSPREMNDLEEKIEDEVRSCDGQDGRMMMLPEDVLAEQAGIMEWQKEQDSPENRLKWEMEALRDNALNYLYRHYHSNEYDLDELVAELGEWRDFPLSDEEILHIEGFLSEVFNEEEYGIYAFCTIKRAIDKRRYRTYGNSN